MTTIIHHFRSGTIRKCIRLLSSTFFYCVETDGAHEISIINRRATTKHQPERFHFLLLFKQKIDASNKRNNLDFLMDKPKARGVTLRRRYAPFCELIDHVSFTSETAILLYISNIFKRINKDIKEKTFFFKKDFYNLTTER